MLAHPSYFNLLETSQSLVNYLKIFGCCIVLWQCCSPLNAGEQDAEKRDLSLTKRFDRSILLCDQVSSKQGFYGNGFFVSMGKQLFVVTDTSHAESISNKSQLGFNRYDNGPEWITFQELLSSPLVFDVWTHSADKRVSVIPIEEKKVSKVLLKRFVQLAIPFSELSEEVPSLGTTLQIVGYPIFLNPLELGVNPLVLTTTVSSDLVFVSHNHSTQSVLISPGSTNTTFGSPLFLATKNEFDTKCVGMYWRTIASERESGALIGIMLPSKHIREVVKKASIQEVSN